MTEQQAVKRIKDEIGWESSELNREAFEMGVKALEKQIPKKPTFDDESSFIRRYHCPECKCVVDIQRYCHHCGQKLDWRNEDEY